MMPIDIRHLIKTKSGFPENTENIYKEITKKADTYSSSFKVNSKKNIEKIDLADPQANKEAKALFAYLDNVRANGKVLFGHQNDLNNVANINANLGDVYDLTNSVSAVYGIDSLGLLGLESGGGDQSSAFANMLYYSKLAVEQGAILTLSTHMPNFTDDKIIKKADGSYDFYKVDFTETKDLSNNCAENILPGKPYNEVFRAYLDYIIIYAKYLDKLGVPLIFRPFHENNGDWFWWGSTTKVSTFKSLFRYTKDYVESKGVHNLLWAYSPNGPFASTEEYLERYPGDDYVDILAFDYYDDYLEYPAKPSREFFDELERSSEVVAKLAADRGKIAAISEVGVRVMKPDNSGNDSLIIKKNPFREAVSGFNWFKEVNEIAIRHKLPYVLLWGNFDATNFFLPYRVEGNLGHELCDEFIEMYNDDNSIFADSTHFYENIDKLYENYDFVD